MTAALRACDGVLLVVDAVEGVMLQTERLIKHALAEQLPLVLLINKVDRLILELKLPPQDAYYKLRHTIEEVNAMVERHAPASALLRDMPRISPEHGNVVFASSLHNWSFSLGSFASLYADYHNLPIDTAEFAKRLWGEAYFDPRSRKFKKRPPYPDCNRSFVQFLLEPLYKIYSHVLGEDSADLAVTLRELGVRVRREELHLDPKPLLRLVLNRFFGTATGLVDMIVQHIPSPNQVRLSPSQAKPSLISSLPCSPDPRAALCMCLCPRRRRARSRRCTRASRTRRAPWRCGAATPRAPS